MSWRPITDDDIRSALTEPEDTMFRERLLSGSGQSDPYAQITSQVTSLFRDAIRSNPGNSLDPMPNTLPEAAIFHATAIIRQRLISRFPSMGAEQDENRKDEAKEAYRYLREIATPGSPTVEAPGEQPQTKQSIPNPSVNQSPRREGWRNQDGI